MRGTSLANDDLIPFEEFVAKLKTSPGTERWEGCRLTGYLDLHGAKKFLGEKCGIVTILAGLSVEWICR